MSNSQNGAPPFVMSVTVFDPFGGAGVIADLNTFAAHNCCGVAAITTLTHQDVGGKSRFQCVNSPWLKQSVQSLLRSQNVNAIKIGMLPNRASAEIVREAVDENRAIPVVLDPSFSGGDTSGGKGLISPEAFRDLLLGRATVVTTNVLEAAALTGLKVDSVEGMKAAAARMVEMGARSAVVTGGRLEKPLDIYYEHGLSEAFVGERIKVEVPPGTRCTFSSAIAANLALGRQPHDAVMLAKAYLNETLRKAFSAGPGPVRLNHFYRLQQTPRVADFVSAVSDTPHQ